MYSHVYNTVYIIFYYIIYIYIYSTIPLHSFQIDPYSTIGHRKRQVATEWVATSERGFLSHRGSPSHHGCFKNNMLNSWMIGGYAHHWGNHRKPSFLIRKSWGDCGCILEKVRDKMEIHKMLQSKRIKMRCGDLPSDLNCNQQSISKKM